MTDDRVVKVTGSNSPRETRRLIEISLHIFSYLGLLLHSIWTLCYNLKSGLNFGNLESPLSGKKSSKVLIKQSKTKVICGKSGKIWNISWTVIF